jgi:hypothetical protein
MPLYAVANTEDRWSQEVALNELQESAVAVKGHAHGRLHAIETENFPVENLQEAWMASLAIRSGYL